MDSKNRVQWVYSSSDNKELEERYNKWVKDYDKDLGKDFEYKAPNIAAEYLAKYVDTKNLILDAGAGTGLVGAILAQMCFKHIVAIDMSQGMLDEARKKNVYEELHRMVLGEHLNFSTRTFDAVICVGTLTLGHAPAASFEELIRVTKPGGYNIFTLRPDIYQGKGFKKLQDKLESGGKWGLIEVYEPFQTLPKGEPDVYHQVWVYKVK